jgi:hypothetical protein
MLSRSEVLAMKIDLKNGAALESNQLAMFRASLVLSHGMKKTPANQKAPKPPEPEGLELLNEFLISEHSSTLLCVL